MYEEWHSFLDSRQIPVGQEVNCDICLIGGGAAGITIARELADQHLKVVILESGGLDYDDAIESLARIVVTGHSYSETDSRLRFFGGSTNHWGGHCVPLRGYVFEKRDWIPDGEWPFGLEELNPYYARAHKVLEIGPYNYDPGPIAKRLQLPLLPLNPGRVQTVLSRYHRQLFGYRYRSEIDRAENISVYLFATALSLQLSHDAHRITSVTAKTFPDKSFTIRPRVVVLAAGGIENARLLLLSNSQASNGIGNQYDLVGRYFADHIWYPSGCILPIDQDRASVKAYESEMHLEDNYSVRLHLALSERYNRELRIPDYRVELIIWNTYEYHEAIVSARRLKRQFEALDPEYLSFEDVLNVMSDPISPIRYLLDRDDAPLVYGFGNYVEQVPNPESRVQLSTEKDAFGMNRPELRWQLSNLDKEGIVKAQDAIAAEVGRSGVGRMQITVPEYEDTILDGAQGGSHHMGTTRMHLDPKRGVVDANARVHGVENLFVAGSSVFPSYGYSNPTLTIVALSIRLADHLKALFRRAL